MISREVCDFTPPETTPQKMNKIPLHTMSGMTDGKIAYSRHTSDTPYRLVAKDTHQNDYYIFILVESGKANILLDFEKYEITENEIFCIPPRQVHTPVAKMTAIEGSFLAVDSVLVRNEYKEIFHRLYLKRNKVIVNETVKSDLIHNFSIIHRRLNSEQQPIEKHILYDLISAYIGFIAETYQKESTISTNSQPAIITSRFKSLLSENHKTLKRPSQYAETLNITSAYLNECVKRITGTTVSQWIQSEITLQAKRLLFYTNLNIKEIALQLGYEDWAYFTRLFTKTAKLSPTQFRKEYLNHHD